MDDLTDIRARLRMLTGFEPDAAETQEILALIVAVSAPLPVSGPLGGEPATTFDPLAEKSGP